MTQQWGQTPASAPPAPSPKRHTGRNVLLAVAAIVVGLMVIGSLGDSGGSTPSAVSTAARPATPAATEAPVAEPTFATPKPRDFTLTVKVLEKTNFGSAGSNITYRIVAGWNGTYDPDKTYEVTYEVRGGEDGPAVNTMTVTGDEYQVEDEEFISTATVGQKLTARVTSVDEA
jgi:hypothetical protein